MKSVMQWIVNAAKWIAKYTVANPFTYDCIVGALAYLTASLGWFKPWLPVCCILYLLLRIFRLRRRLNAFLRPAGISAVRGADGIIRPG